MRTSLLKAYGPALRKRLDAASRLLTTLRLRGLNQQVIDGRLPEAVGGEFIDANGLGGRAARRVRGPRILVGYMDFDENRTLAYLYAEALRAGGYRVRVRSVGGLRPEAVRLLRRDRIDLYPDYSGSLLRYLVGTQRKRLAAGLRRTLDRIDAKPLRRARAQDRNVFVTKTATAAALGLSRISDLGRYWQTPGA
jgi:glycine betaine/choline ABC-type transport system substrate-binding protein